MSGPIKFTCPRCNAQHERGYVDGVRTFRCLLCGYLGRGFHPDAEIDAEVTAAIDQANAWNRAHGLPEDHGP